MKKIALLGALLTVLVSCGTTPPAPTSTQADFTAQGLHASRGLFGKYFRQDANGAAFLDHFQVDKSDGNLWAVQPKSGAHAAVWNARLTAPTAGTYTFYLTANGYAELTINGQQVAVHPEETGGEVSTSWTFTQANEMVDLAVKYTANQTPKKLRLEWITPNGRREVIPTKFFSPVDLTADCQKQPTQACLAKFTMTTQGTEAFAKVGWTAFLDFNVQNESDIYELNLRIHNDFTGSDMTQGLPPSFGAGWGWMVQCNEAGLKTGSVTVTRVEDGLSKSINYQVTCFE